MGIVLNNGFCLFHGVKSKHGQYRAKNFFFHQRRFQWNIELTQRLAQSFEAGECDASEKPDYYFRSGSTLIVDAETGRVRYSIRKPVTDRRKESQRRYFLEEGNRNLATTYFGGIANEDNEPFAMLHRFPGEIQP